MSIKQQLVNNSDAAKAQITVMMNLQIVSPDMKTSTALGNRLLVLSIGA